MILLIIGGGLAGLAALPRGGGAAAQETSTRQDVITSDSHFFGQSPPVYPSPETAGLGEWADSFTKAKIMVGQMSLEEKLNITGGIPVDNGCSGNIPGIPRLGFPGMCLSDAGNGLRATDFVSSWPSGIHVGASWNKDLARSRAFWMGAEFRKKGVNVLLGPVVGPMGRTVRGGRNWEGMSVDPYLAGVLVHETVVGTQQMGVITSTKHFIANEQETARMPSGDVQALSSNIDDKTMHEFYLWPFQDAVHAGTANIMCSYQRVNNSYGCANSKTMNGLLKTELGFQGFVVSDWGAQLAGVATALAGLDMTMPTGATYWGENLAASVRNNSIPEARVTDMTLRIIASWYRLGQDKDFPAPGFGMPANVAKPHAIVDARNSSAKPTLLEGAIEGHVLVKNTNNALPLNKPRMISVFGYSAKLPDINGPTGPGVTAWTFGGISANSTEVIAGFSGGAPEQVSGIAANGTLFSGGGSGATSQSWLSAPFDALVQQAQIDDTEMYWDFKSGNPIVPSMSDACLVLGNAFASESYDRPGLRDDFTDGLILNVANQCNNTVVVLHNAGIRVVDRFVDHPNVTALIFAHLPGQYSGRALVSLLYGETNPSGKLPYTVARNESDYGAVHAPDVVDKAGIYRNFPQADFAEGVFVDYRYFDARNITPRYEFGFGLSYTTFEYANLRIDKPANATGNGTAEYPTGPIMEGGQTDLWHVLVTVTADIANTGKLGGAEVAQLYLSVPGAGSGNATAGGTPIRQLRGFEKPFINATQTATANFALTRRDLSVWDVVAQKWKLQAGTYTVFVGSSSRRLPLNGTFTLP